MNKQTVLKSVAVQDATLGGNSLACKPSVMGVLDLYGDVIFPGAFGTCLSAFLRRGFVPTDHNWEWTALVGFPTVAEERGNILYSEFTFHSDQASQDAMIKCRERLDAGLEVGLSIGFSMMPGQYIYFENGKALLAYAKKNGYDLKLFDTATISACNEACCAIIAIEELWEYSLTPSPANQAAMAIAVKSARGVRLSAKEIKSRVTRREGSMKLNAICGAPALLLAQTDAKWSAKAAEARLREFTGATDAPNAAYAKGFVLVDGPNDEFESYKLQFVDVVDGKLIAVPKALMSAANVLGGITGAGFDVTDDVHTAAKTFVEGYYTKMPDASVPWSKSGDGVVLWKGQYLGEYVERRMCMAAIETAFYALYYEISDALGGWGDYEGMDPSEVCDAISGMHDEFKGLCLAVVQCILGGDADESAEEAMLSVRRAVTQHMSSLGDGLSYTQHARIAVDASEQLIKRTKDRSAMRLKEGRALSEANRQTLKDHSATLKAAAATIDQLLADTEPKADAAKVRKLRIEFLRLATGRDAAAA